MPPSEDPSGPGRLLPAVLACALGGALVLAGSGSAQESPETGAGTRSEPDGEPAPHSGPAAGEGLDAQEAPLAADMPLDDVEARVDALARQPSALEEASAAIRHCRLAISRSRELSTSGHPEAAERARSIAAAALLLSVKQVMRGRERVALEQAQAEVVAARARSRSASEALEQLLSRRAAGLSEEPPAQPTPSTEGSP